MFPSRLPLRLLPVPRSAPPPPGFATGVILWCLDEQIFFESSEDTRISPSGTQHHARGRALRSGASGFWEEPVLDKVYLGFLAFSSV